MIEVLTLALAEAGSDPGSAQGVFRFFAALVLILVTYISAWGFTYWISKDE
ncbi:MAG: hypothetical protein ACR2KW_02445 [Rubrobacter sp.]